MRCHLNFFKGGKCQSFGCPRQATGHETEGDSDEGTHAVENKSVGKLMDEIKVRMNGWNVVWKSN